MIRLTTLRIPALALCLAAGAFGYIGETFTVGTPDQTVQVVRADGANLQFYLNSQVVAGVKSSLSGATVITASSNPTVAVEAAMAGWNGVTTANIHFNPLQSTAAVHDSTDCQNVISIASTAADLSILGGSGGVVAVTVNSFVQSAGSVCGGSVSVAGGTIIDSDILLNPYIAFSTDSTANTKDVQGVIMHEFGHMLGMNHSGLLGATMYPYANLYQRHLSWDEKAYANVYYPTTSRSVGTIAGTITLGSAPVKFGLVTLIDQAAGKTLGALTGADGTYSIQAPPGSYIIYAEPFNSFVGPGNIYSLTSSTGLIDPTQVTTAFEPTFLGSSSSPTVVPLASGAIVNASITVASGATTLTAPFFGIGKAGGNGDITSFSSIGGAIPVTAGKTFDLALAGTGIDATISLLAFGGGVTVNGAPRADTAITLSGGLPVIRISLTITPQTVPSLGSLWIVKGGSILSLSAALDVEPTIPSVSNVQDAESARTSIVSGQYVAIYGLNLAGNTRTWAPNANVPSNNDFTGGVTAGSPLPITLDGVSVTVNSIPAAIYFISPGQINIIAPSNLPSGPASVVVSNNASASTPFTLATIAQASPSFFIYGAGGTEYPVAFHLDGTLVGDPAVQSGSRKANINETLIMFANGLGSSPGGVIATVAGFSGQVTMTAGTSTLNVLGAALVYAGEYQVNVQMPASIPQGNYNLTMTVPGASTATSGITVVLPVGP